jgi:hypothetical protein
VADAEPERGRQADTPSEIPAKGWKDIALRLYREFGNDRILLVAAGVTFYAILALFPAVAALVSIYGAVADPSTINTHLNELRGILPDGAIDIVGGQVKRLTAKGDTALGLTAVVSILISLWSANGGMKAIFDALNIAYEEEEKRSFVMLNLQSLAFTVGALLFVVLALTGIVVVPAARARPEGLVHRPAPIPGPAAPRDRRPGGALSLRPEPPEAEVALGDLGQRGGRHALAARVGPVLLVRGQFRQLQRDLRLARRRDRLHDLDLALDDGGAARGRAQRRDGAPDRPRHHGRRPEAARCARGPHGRYRRGVGLTGRSGGSPAGDCVAACRGLRLACHRRPEILSSSGPTRIPPRPVTCLEHVLPTHA